MVRGPLKGRKIQAASKDFVCLYGHKENTPKLWGLVWPRYMPQYFFTPTYIFADSEARPIQAASLEQWQERRAFLQKRAMAGFGLDPRPPDVPLDLTYGTRIERDDCTLTRVDFQTFPGFYATAWLYMPKNATFPAPAVLHPHGHWANWSADP